MTHQLNLLKDLALIDTVFSKHMPKISVTT